MVPQQVWEVLEAEGYLGDVRSVAAQHCFSRKLEAEWDEMEVQVGAKGGALKVPAAEAAPRVAWPSEALPVRMISGHAR